MKKIIILFFLLFSSVCFSQETLSELLNRFNQKSVPYISVQELAMPKTDVILLDSREPNEFKVSHLKNAICIGYNNFNIEDVTNQIEDKNQPIVVYCSLGIRSETVAEKLKDAGFTNVKNLYGGIFEWKNKNRKVFNMEGKVTDSVHAFSRSWSKWLKNGIKYYPKLEENDR